MTDKAQTIRLVGKMQRAFAKQCVDRAPDGWVCRIAAETRRDKQNRLLWALIADLRRQLPEMACYAPDDIKMRFLNALGHEMRFLPTLEGEGMFPVGLRSSTLTVQQFAGLIELIKMHGAQRGVVFRDDELPDAPGSAGVRATYTRPRGK